MTLREMIEQSKMRMAQNAMSTPSNGTMMSPTGSTMMAPGMAMTPASSMAAMASLSAQDQLFITRAGEGNLAEITEAQMAVQKSKNTDVKNTAQTIITGHSQAQTDLMNIVMGKGIMFKPVLSPTHMAVGDMLKKEKGMAFDKTYMANQTDDHENTVALFQSEIEQGTDPELKAYAQKYLPDIVGHTIMIYTVAKQVGAPGSDMRPPSPPVPPGITPTMMPMPGMSGTMPGM